jgi:DNA-binding HxlR family transcriptional regulator
MTSAPKVARRHTEVTKAHTPPHSAPQAGAHSGCVAVREVLNLVGDKWSVLVVRILGGGSLRFTEIKRSIEGISQRMLTLTLRGLERDGMLTRSVTPTIPPRVDYELTKLALTLLDPVRALAKWAERNRTAIQAARDRFDQAATPRQAGGGRPRE